MNFDEKDQSSIFWGQLHDHIVGLLKELFVQLDNPDSYTWVSEYLTSSTKKRVACVTFMSDWLIPADSVDYVTSAETYQIQVNMGRDLFVKFRDIGVKFMMDLLATTRKESTVDLDKDHSFHSTIRDSFSKIYMRLTWVTTEKFDTGVKRIKR